MRTNRNCKRYAGMFLNSVGFEEAPAALEELAMVNSLMEKSPEMRSLLVSPLFSGEERRSAFEAVGERLNLSGSTVKFVNYLSGEKAAWALGDVLRKAVAIYSEKKNKVMATVITSAAVGREFEDRLREALGRITKREVGIEYMTDPGLLGGMLVKVGSTMFDGSIKGQLRLLKEELIKG